MGDIISVCSLVRYTGQPGTCHWCGVGLHPSRERWCSTTCSNAYGLNHYWTKARRAALDRDSHRCRSCGASELAATLNVHHIEPCRGVRHQSCAHHLANLETLCERCHDLEHRQAQMPARGEHLVSCPVWLDQECECGLGAVG